MTVIAEPWNWRGGRIRDAFLDAVRTVADLAADPAVAAAWNEPGVLKNFSVRGLVGHMFWQELALPGMLSDPVPAEPVVSLRESYLQRVTWLDAGAHGAVSVRIRQGGEATAADGHEELLAGVREAIGRLRTQVPDASAVRPVRVSTQRSRRTSISNLSYSRRPTATGGREYGPPLRERLRSCL
ncbi:maleylpyruvate isomerase N-terminal domain-containing protein [Streptomyces sp. NPDC058145]|uniref:maleylpyruvate isomerase N-terminal domain-containing protein n=1 Tax=Streptomyces sp. NPDC058145 TaxID=3346356 RepID=UPI0036E25A2E